MLETKIFSTTTVNTLTLSKKRNHSQPSIRKTLFYFCLSSLVNDCILMYLETMILSIYNFLILHGCLFGVFFFLHTLAPASLKSWVRHYLKYLTVN